MTVREEIPARGAPAGNGNAAYRFDTRLQRDNETVFFDV